MPRGRLIIEEEEEEEEEEETIYPELSRFHVLRAPNGHHALFIFKHTPQLSRFYKLRAPDGKVQRGPQDQSPRRSSAHGMCHMHASFSPSICPATGQTAIYQYCKLPAVHTSHL
eukprot:1155594-Pelagomonas_calceolata.AAC.3